MPELPEVETVRRMLESHVVGRRIASVKLSGKPLRGEVARDLPKRAAGRAIERVERHGKYLLIGLSGGVTLISHLGMSGRWLFHAEPPARAGKHVHARITFEDGSALWFDDPRRFGLLRAVATATRFEDPALAILGPDPVLDPPDGARLMALARGARIAVKLFLLDQKRLAGVGNIYASEVLFRAGVDPRRRAGAITRIEWDAIAREIIAVLGEAIDRMGTTFSMYRTLWNEPGSYGERLLVYDRAGEPCRVCGTPLRRIVQGARSTFFCPNCQKRGESVRPRAAGKASRSRPGRRAAPAGPARTRRKSRDFAQNRAG